MRGNTLVTGGSDGSVRVWSLEKMAPIHRLAAHDNSVTSLQFDDTRVVSGGSDGRVKVWDLKTGQLVRELTAPADAVWRVAFEEEKCVVMASRASRTIMEVCIASYFSCTRLTDGTGLVFLATRRDDVRPPINHRSTSRSTHSASARQRDRVPLRPDNDRPTHGVKHQPATAYKRRHAKSKYPRIRQQQRCRDARRRRASSHAAGSHRPRHRLKGAGTRENRQRGIAS